MIMNFDSIPLQHLPHFKGGEGEVLANMYTDAMGKIARLTLPVGASIGMHTHTGNAEIMYLLSGSGTLLENDDAPKAVSAGMCCYCPQGQQHSLVNTGSEPLVLLAVIPELG